MAPTSTFPNAGAQRFVPLLCILVVLLAVLLTGLRIVSSGFVAEGDARRHVGRALADKSFRDIVVMKPFYVVDHSFGWEGLLRLIRRATGCGPDALMSFSVFSLLTVLLAAPMCFLRRPEAWLAAVLAQLIAIPELPIRWTQGRPFLLTEAILICLLLVWSRPAAAPSRLKIALTFAAFTLSVWMHGAWYLWILLPPAFCLAGQWRSAAWLTACWIGGCLAGGILTGHPVAFLQEQVLIARAIRAEHLPARLLVGEFQPHQGELASVTLLALVYLWGVVRQSKAPPLAQNPAFWLLAIGWALGFIADRFWADWGLPAALVWMALQFDDTMTGLWPSSASQRLLACCAIAVPLYLDTSSDLNQRYTRTLNDTFLDASEPALQGWMPEPGGIFYSAQMSFFYNTFYSNPRADWRYILAFEPALMPDEDLRIFRRIQLSNFTPDEYERWVKKMRPGDRLEIESLTQPAIPELEWKRATGHIWIGRLPRGPAAPKQKS